MLKTSKLGPSLIFGILGTELFLMFPLELILSVNRIGASLDIVTLAMPPYKCSILKKRIAHFLSVLYNAYCLEIGLKSPNEIVNLPYTPSPIEGWRRGSIHL